MSHRHTVTRLRPSRSLPPLAGLQPLRHTLLMPAMVSILAVVLVQAVVGIHPVIYLVSDPRYEQMAVSATVLGPFGSMLLNCISIALAALGLAVHIAAGGRIKWWQSLLVLSGCLACAYHLPNHVDNLFRCGQWAAAACLGLAGLHLAEHEGPRRLVVAALAALIVPLTIDSVWYVTYEHQVTLKNFLAHEEAFLQSKAWAKGSPQHQLFLRRMSGNDATGAFGLSNVFGSIAAAVTLVTAALAAHGMCSRQWSRAILPGTLTCLGLLCIGLSRSKGATAALIAGFALIAATHWIRRSRFGAHWSRLLAAAAIMLVLLAITMVFMRGSLGPPKSVDGERSLLFRHHYWLAASRTIETAPIFKKLMGVGPAGFREAYFIHKQAENPEEVISTHNVFLDYGTMLGLGGVLWSVLLIGWIWQAGRRVEAPELKAEAVPTTISGRAGINSTYLSWAGLLALPVFFTELVLEIQKMLFLERLLLWVAGVSGFVAVATVLLDPKRFDKRWLNIGLFVAATALLIHGQIEMTFFHQGAVAITWLVIGVAGSPLSDYAQPHRAVAKIGFVLPALLVLGATCIFGTQMPRLLRHQSALAAAETALRENQLSNAAAHLERAIHALPIDPRPYRWQASLRLENARTLLDHGRVDEANQQIERALQYLDRASQVGFDEPVRLRTQSQVLEQVAEWRDDPELLQTAARLARELLDRRPYNLQNHLAAADLHWRAGRFDQARTYYRRCLELSDQARLDPARQLMPRDRVRVEERSKE